MKKLLLLFLGTALVSTSVIGQNKGLLISEVLTNPSGSDSPFEYVELLATASINFAATPYTVVFTDNGTATANGWAAGSPVTYAFLINTGSVTAGQVVYVGGTSMAPLSNSAVALRTRNTGTTNGDVLGAYNTAGVLGNGGNNCDGVAVFNTTVASITPSTVPVDAIFFGNSVGSAFTSATTGYQLPVNDKYPGGKLLTSSFLAADPGSDELIKASSGTFNPLTNTFTAIRNWSITTTASYNTSSIVLGTVSSAAPALSFNTAASKLVDLASATISCVMDNDTDPFIITGLDINLADQDLNTLTFSMTSSATTVVGNSNFTVTGTGATRKFRIAPTGVGYATITLKVTNAQGLNSTVSLNVAVSASLATASVNDIYNTGVADGSTAVAIDANYMFVADDETNVIKLYDRNHSGLSLYQFDVNSNLNLSGTEVDMEASFRSPTNPNRIYWLGSMSNSKTGQARPDRNRIFATDIVGTGAAATLQFVGYYDNLRAKLITWGNANGYDFTAKAAVGIIPKRIDGFNIEGLEIGPDGTTLYIGFRAPYVGAGTNKALICPLLNFESWFGNGSPGTNPTFGAPIELDLNNHGIRSIGKNAANQYLISAGSYAADGTYGLFSWNGLAASAPVQLTVDLTNLKPEGIVEVPVSIAGSFTIDLVSDLGSNIIYNDGLENKDVVQPVHRKFLTSTLNVVNPELSTVQLAAQNNGFMVYPNPATNQLIIEFKQTPRTAAPYYIYAMNGTLIKQVPAVLNSNKTVLDISGLAAGNYLIQSPAFESAIRVSKK